MDFKEYILGLEKPADFTSTGIDKSMYLDIMEIALSAYEDADLKERIKKYRKYAVEDIQAFSRITLVLGALLANGRKQGYYDLWESMMDLCCRDLSTITGDGRLDFSVKETLLAYKAMKRHVPEKKKREWAEQLGKIDPYVNYAYTLKTHGEEELHNINIYNMVGEYLRESEGLTDTKAYFDRHWPVQLSRFDGNGMYRDPGCPMVYDIVTRGQIELLFAFGYRGKFYDALDRHLETAGFFTLFMQSVNGELPFGGRSNQFLFNEAYVAAHCEYEAARYHKRGETKIAGAYKRCAHLSIQSVLRWIQEAKPPKHIRNFYPVMTRHGEEGYAYYDKYMVTLAVNVYSAFLFADDRIEEKISPAEAGGYFFKTSDSFHKVFANCLGNFVEIETKANPLYDSTGLGRFHKAGIPSELMLSTPCTKTPRYLISEGIEKENLSICPGWSNGQGKIQYLSLCGEGLVCETECIRCDKEQVSFTLTYSGEAIEGCRAVREIYRIDKGGVHIKAELMDPAQNKIFYQVPLFCSNGKDTAAIIQKSAGNVTVQSGKFRYRVETDGAISAETVRYGNRNGEYTFACVEKEGSVLQVNLNGF